MSYEPTVWKTGDIVSSEKLNKLENSLASEESRAKSEEARIEELFTTPTQEAVNSYLDAHPEATTTVQDGAITYEKLSTGLKEKCDDVDDLKADLSDLESDIFEAGGSGEYPHKTVLEMFSDGSRPGCVIYPPSSTTTMGIVTSDGAAFNSWYVKFTEATDIFFDASLNIGLFVTGQISNVTAITPSGAQDLIFTGTNPVRNRYTDGTGFPTETNKMHVSANDTIMISLGSSVNPGDVLVYYGEKQSGVLPRTVLKETVKLNNAQIEQVLSDEAKAALLACFRHLALWNDQSGSTYVDILESALNPSDFPKITASLDSSYNPIITDDVNTLKPHMTVTYYESEESSGQTVSAEEYSLVGNLNNPQNDIVVSYGTCSTTLTVNVLDIYNIHRWEFPSNTLIHSATGVFDDASKLTPNNNRRSLYLDHGMPIHRVTYANGDSINDGNAYYIPVPSDATQVKVTISPSSWSIAFHVLKIVEGSPVGWIAGADGWSAGTKTATFNAGEGMVLGVSYRNGDASLVSSDASSVVVEFS